MRSLKYDYRQGGFEIEPAAVGLRRVFPLGGSAGIMVTTTTPMAVTLSESTHVGDLSTGLIRGEGISWSRELK